MILVLWMWSFDYVQVFTIMGYGASKYPFNCYEIRQNIILFNSRRGKLLLDIVDKKKSRFLHAKYSVERGIALYDISRHILCFKPYNKHCAKHVPRNAYIMRPTNDDYWILPHHFDNIIPTLFGAQNARCIQLYYEMTLTPILWCDHMWRGGTIEKVDVGVLEATPLLV